MRILFTNTGPWGTGAGTVINGVSQILRNQGHAVKIVFPDLGLNSRDKEAYYQNKELFHIIKFPRTHKNTMFPTFPLIIPDTNPRNLKNAWTYKDLSEEQLLNFIDLLRMEFKKVIDDFEPDVIETEHIWLMGTVLSEFNIPLIACAHNSDQIGFHYDKRMQSYAIKCAQKSEYLFALNESLKEQIISLYKVKPEKVIIIPNGFDRSIFCFKKTNRKALLKDYHIDDIPALPIVTFPGKLSKTKGVDTLLKANALVQKEHPFLLLLFGSGEIEEALGHSPSREEMENVHIMGHVTPSELASFHNIAKFCIQPSRSEGFCIAALEAMGCALPLIATPVGSMNEFGVGKIVPVDDFSTLAKYMESFLRIEEEKFAILKQKALNTSKSYMWESVVNHRIKYYEILSNDFKGVV